MQEYAFELALCAALERPDRIYARQLGGAVHGGRVVDVVALEPGPEFETRAAITPHTIPPLAVESDVGPGAARRPAAAFDCHPERAREVAERAVELGFFERERRGGHTTVRQTARYPDWFGDLVAIENKPDLERPGDLRDQLQTDVSLGLFDRVVLATESYVTGAHLNRFPDAVGVWRFDPETGERTVVREPAPLDTDAPGIELLDRKTGRTDVRPVDAAAKRDARRRIAERAYGKGWRTYELPDCERCSPGVAACGDGSDAAGLPWCTWHGRPVQPVTECGADCEGHEPTDSDESADPGESGDPDGPVEPAESADSTDIDLDALRAERSPWVADPDGLDRRQVGLDQFGE